MSFVPASGGKAWVCREILYSLDIRPGSCPNPFNLKLFDMLDGMMPGKGGVLPVAVLGTEGFDVRDIDLSSLRLEGIAPAKTPVFSDVSRPAAGGGECPCTKEGPDGYEDIVLKFRSLDIAAAIAPGAPGDRTKLTLTGNLLDGESFELQDCITFVGPRIQLPRISQTPSLFPAAPNPFNPVTRIRFHVPEEMHATLSVYDVNGELVAELLDGRVSAGDHVVTWEAAGIPSGVYFYRLDAGDYSKTRKMVLIK